MQRKLLTISMFFISVFFMKAQEPAKIKITIGTTSFVVTTYDNATAKAFIALLPISITMNELNGNEKYYYLSVNLPNSPSNPSTIQNGDLMLYGSNCIVLFYETFSTSYSYTKIGTVDNPTGLKTALRENNPTVTFELIGTTSGIGSTELNSNEFNISNEGILQYTGTANKISLLNINGSVLSTTTTKVLNINNFSRGIYLLKIESQEQKQTHTVKFKY